MYMYLKVLNLVSDTYYLVGSYPGIRIPSKFSIKSVNSFLLRLSTVNRHLFVIWQICASRPIIWYYDRWYVDSITIQYKHTKSSNSSDTKISKYQFWYTFGTGIFEFYAKYRRVSHRCSHTQCSHLALVYMLLVLNFTGRSRSVLLHEY